MAAEASNDTATTGNSVLSDYISWLTDTAKSAAEAYQAWKGASAPNPNTTTTTTTGAEEFDWKKYGPWIGGGVLVLLLMILAFRSGK